MKLRPIRTDDDYAAAIAEIEKLWGAAAGTPRGDKLDILLTLTEAWEREYADIAPPTAIEAIHFRMEQGNLCRKDLEPLIGSRGRVSEVLNGKRELSINMIRALHRELGIPLESLINA